MEDIAIVAFAQSTLNWDEDPGDEVELVLPVVQEAVKRSGLKRQDIDVTVSGSTDYLLGRPFSFVTALDAVGAWPPIDESHVEMDGAFALYEAYVRLLHGEEESALVYAFGRSSMGDIRDILVAQLDPYYTAPLWPDSVSLAAMQAQAMFDEGKITPEQLAEITVRSRRDAKNNPNAHVKGDVQASELLKEPYVVEPLRKHNCCPVSDGAAAIVLARGDLARKLCDKPAWIRGMDHRIEAHAFGSRDLTRSVSTEQAAKALKIDGSKVDVAELYAPFAHQEVLLTEALGLGENTRINPSGGALCGHALMVAGLTRMGEAASQIMAGNAKNAVAHATSGPCLQQNLLCVLEGLTMGNRCAIIGIGQTKHDTARKDVSIPGLVREATLRALEDAGLTFADIDCVVIGKAPDSFEGVMMPELFLAGALGAVGKPMIRVHTAGSVGGSTAHVAAHMVQSGKHRRVLTLAFEKQSESDAMWALSPKIPFQPPLLAGAGGYFAPLIRSYMRRSGAPDHIGIKVAVKDRLCGLKNPYAHLHMEGINEEMVRKSPMLWAPIRYLETCPSSDGAVAMVLCDEEYAKKSPHPPAWVLGTAVRSEPTAFAGRDQVNPQAGRDCAKALYAQAGITNPRKEIDVGEIYVPFSWFEPMWMENLGFAEVNEGWKMTDDGTTDLGGELPINPSGGVMCTNPIGASGMLRFAEAARQVRGQAGDHQVKGAKIAMGHAYGGGSQFFAMWLVGSEKP